MRCSIHHLGKFRERSAHTRFGPASGSGYLENAVLLHGPWKNWSRTSYNISSQESAKTGNFSTLKLPNYCC